MTPTVGPLAAARSKSALAGHTLLNLVGTGGPVVAAVIAMPLLAAGFGTERLGLLLIAWAVLGYFSIFDLGLSRALTHSVAVALGTGRRGAIPGLIWTGMAAMVAIGAGGGLLLGIVARPLALRVITMPAELEPEAVGVLLLLAVSLPIVISTAGLRGVLEGAQRFGAINVVRVAMGLSTFLGPLVVLPFTRSLVPAVALLVVVRAGFLAVHVWLCVRTFPELRHVPGFDPAIAASLLRFGGWVSVSVAASSSMLYVDRFVIGALLSVTAVSYYAVPYDMLLRLMMVPIALGTAALPQFASAGADPARIDRLYDWCMRSILMLMFPACLLLVAFGGEGLGLWLGEEFARNGTSVLRWMTLGLFVNAVAIIAATGLQGTGRPRSTAIVNVVELPFYLAALWWLLNSFGIVGAAAAWTLRALADTAALLWIVYRTGELRAATLRRIVGLGTAAAGAMTVPVLIPSPVFRLVYVAVALAVFVPAGWRWLMTAEERASVLSRLTRRRIRSLLPGDPGGSGPFAATGASKSPF